MNLKSNQVRNNFLLELMKNFRQLIPPNGRRKLYMLIAIQISLSMLDLIGVGLLGILVSSILGGYKAIENHAIIVWMLKTFGIDDFNEFLITMSVFVAIVFLTKNFASGYMSWKTFNFLAFQQTMFSRDYLRVIFASDYDLIRREKPETIAYALNEGSTAAIIGVIGNFVNLICDLFLLVLLFFVLISIEPIPGLLTLLYFALVALFITYYVQRPIASYSIRSMKSNIEYRTSITSVLRLFREIKILNKDPFYEKKLNYLKNENANVGAVTTWLGQIPKALLESAMLIGLLILVVAISTPKGDVTSHGVLGIYIASATRLVPAILRVQSSLYLIRTSLPGANKALSLLSFFENSRKSKVLNIDGDLTSSAYNKPKDFIKIKQMSFGYKDTPNGLIYRDFDLNISKGERIALTGPSGGGKSTLVDLILGLLRPVKGQILIEEIASNLWIKRNPGSVSYLPQDTHFIHGSILENICLGEDESDVNPERLESALTNAKFLEVIKKLEFGLQTKISENNPLLSGGEKQRLGIARTLYTQPALIIMDEASSAMDSRLESEFLDSLKSISKDVTVIFIAHRHNSLRNFNRILYVNEGLILADGTYDEVCNILPEFNHRADS